MTTYEIISLDVWGHGPDECAALHGGECDGYQVNDLYRTGRTIEITDDKSDTIKRALIAEGYLVCEPDAIEIDGDDCTLFINRKSDNRPLLQLHLKTDQ